jgi:plasmid stabilization system protein ParE
MLIVRREAEQDIKEAYEWYEDARPNLGRKFVAEIQAKLESIDDNPDLYPNVYQNVRRALCNRFPYSIYLALIVSPSTAVGAPSSARRAPTRGEGPAPPRRRRWSGFCSRPII